MSGELWRLGLLVKQLPRIRPTTPKLKRRRLVINAARDILVAADNRLTRQTLRGRLRGDAEQIGRKLGLAALYTPSILKSALRVLAVLDASFVAEQRRRFPTLHTARLIESGTLGHFTFNVA